MGYILSDIFIFSLYKICGCLCVMINLKLVFYFYFYVLFFFLYFAVLHHESTLTLTYLQDVRPDVRSKRIERPRPVW